MEAVLRFAPAPVLSRFWEAGAQALKTVRNLFAAKLLAANPAREDAQADVNTRAAEILDTHGNAILRYAYSYLHNMEDAEEVLQDTLVQFLKTAPAFESEAHEKAWLLRVAGNLSKNRLSYNAVRAADELNDELVAENRDDLSFVWQAVRDLPEKYRAPRRRWGSGAASQTPAILASSFDRKWGRRQGNAGEGYTEKAIEQNYWKSLLALGFQALTLSVTFLCLLRRMPCVSSNIRI